MKHKNSRSHRSGTMGNGIAHVFAKSAYNVVLVDIEQRFVDRGWKPSARTWTRSLQGQPRQERTRPGAGPHHPSYRRKQLANATSRRGRQERFEIKAELFRDLDAMCRPEVILSSNTSSIFHHENWQPVTKRPDKVIGMHFFNLCRS